MKLLNRQEVTDLLGVCDRTLNQLIKDEGLPMSRCGRSFKGFFDDLKFWIRSRYPDQYKSLIDNAKIEDVTTRTRGQFDTEEYGIAERPNGERYIVEGRNYIEISITGEKDGDVLVQKRTRGNCSFEQTKREYFA